jgi:hypothetical protein
MPHNRETFPTSYHSTIMAKSQTMNTPENIPINPVEQLERLKAAAIAAHKNRVAPQHLRNKMLIQPTRRELEQMRQISGLGMEDPALGGSSKNQNGQQQLHASLIFEDMCLNDLPEDCKDMVSVASDPTARAGDGIDLELFHASLGTMNVSASHNIDGNGSFILSSENASSKPPATAATSEQAQQTKVRIACKIKTKKKLDSKLECDKKVQEKLHNSFGTLPSLDLDHVFADAKNSRTSPSSSLSKLSRVTPDKMNDSSRASGMSNGSAASTDHLMLEAALAAHKDGTTSKELVMAALSSSISDMSFDPQDRVLRKKGSMDVVAGDAYEAPAPGTPERRKDKLAAKSRALPNIIALFPVEGAPRRKRPPKSI